MKVWWMILCGLLLFNLPIRAQKIVPFGGTLKKAGDETLLKNTAALTVGNWYFWVNNNGLLAYHGGCKGIFPKRTAPLLYMNGLLWGGRLKNPADGKPIDDQPLRVGGVYYRSGLQPGRIDANGQAAGADDPTAHIYFIRKDWRRLSKAQLKSEAAFYFDTDTSAVTEEMISRLKEALALNWKNWPVEFGAPYNDVDGNGRYNPLPDADGYPDTLKQDYPGIADADQVIWFVANDLNDAHVYNLSGSKPIGLELQMTLWTYKGHFTPFSQTVFVRYRLINKSPYLIDSMYISLADDPDVGYFGDDLVGCDSLRNMWFAYNGNPVDAEYNKYGLNPAAVGFSLLAGPLVKSDNPSDLAFFDFKEKPGFRNLPLTSFVYLGSGTGSLGDPPMGVYDFTVRWYNMMRGFAPVNDPYVTVPYQVKSGPHKGQPTFFPFSGDPVNDPTGLYGDVDGANTYPADRRMAGNVGPFRMAPGETQEWVVAISAGMGKDNRQSVVELKAINGILRGLLKNNFRRMAYAPPAPAVQARSVGTTVVLNWGGDETQVQRTENWQTDDFRFEGYNVYQLPSPQARPDDPRAVRIATFDLQDGVFSVWGWKTDPITGKRLVMPLFEGKDTGLQRHLFITRDYINDQPLYLGSTYYFAVTAYDYHTTFPSFPGYESPPALVQVTVQGPNPGERFEARPGDTLQVYTNRTSEVLCKVRVVDPSQTTGHVYRIFFTTDADSASPTFGQWRWNLKDSTTGVVCLADQPVHLIRNKQGRFEAQDERVADGLAVYVQMPSPRVKTANANGAGQGQIARMPKRNDEDLTFWFKAPGHIEHDLNLAKKDVEKINVFPNPFYAGAVGPDGLRDYVTFNHLPQRAIIRIFDLGGHPVRKLEKDDPSQFLVWDLRNAKGQPVASGLYIVHIEMPELKKTKELKLMIIQGEH